MASYRPCPSCARHVRSRDLACPFCSAPAPPAHRFRHSPCGPPASRGRTRGSRATWLACGAALAAVGCTDSGAAPGGSAADATYSDDVPAEGEPAEASAETSLDAAIDGRVDGTSGSNVDADAAEATAFEGGFICIPAGIQGDAAIVCDPRTQFCHLHSGNLTAPSACAPLDPTCLAYPPIADASTCSYLASAPCDGGLRCSCIALEAYSATSDSCTACSDDDAGGLTLSCGACYGAPPVDLRRWRATA
jgi:hypothetical protein